MRVSSTQAANTRPHLDGHELNGCVALLLDAGQHVVTELCVRADALVLARHADVGLVDAQALGAAGALVAPAATHARAYSHKVHYKE